MHRLSADPVNDSKSWNHSDSYRDCVSLCSLTYVGIGPIALRICRLDPSASFGLYKGGRVELKYSLWRTLKMVSCMHNIWSMAEPIQGLGYCRGEEQKKPSIKRFATERPGRQH